MTDVDKYPINILSDRLVMYYGYHAYYCPGCKHLHRFAVDKDHVNSSGETIRWAFDDGHGHRNLHLPTFNPSYLRYMVDSQGNQVTACHSYTKQGMIEFLNDCPHELRGKTVPIPTISEWPEHYFSESAELR